MFHEEQKTIINKTIVLLIDDQMIVAEAVRRMLSAEPNVVFHYCNDPSVAIETAKKIKPTIILQDLVMPQMDGISLLKRLRADEFTKVLPVVVLSSEEDAVIKSQAFEVGASDYLVKLPDRIELIARIHAHCRSYFLRLERDEANRKLRELQAELLTSNAALEELSCMDGLTGIANRRRFDDFMRKEWKLSHRNKYGVSLILIDVDHFKAYNDNYGHQQGDNVLIRVATALNKVLNRPTDLLARYGGEEFVVVLPDTNLKGAMQIAHLLLQEMDVLHIPHAYSSVTDYVTISLGVAACRPADPKHTAEDLLDKADRSLYEAKRLGRNCIANHKALAPKS